MPRLRLKLTALCSILAVVAPASADRPVPADQDRPGCPYERAELAAAAYATLPLSVEGDPAEGSLFDPSRRSALLP